MISKETFCSALRLRDKHFLKDCKVSSFFDEQYPGLARVTVKIPSAL